LTEDTLRLARLARVVPVIRDYDRTADTLAAFADLPVISDGFADDCDAGLAALEAAEAALRDAESRRTALNAKIGALVPHPGVLEAESAIRDAGEAALHVGKARDDRPNRDDELAELSGKLKIVRAAVGLPDDAALEMAAPPADSIVAVQRLAAQALERRGKAASLAAESERENKTLDVISARQEQRRAAGADLPSGVPASAFADLAALEAAAEVKGRQVRQARAAIDAGLTRLAMADLDALIAFPCPDAAVIQAEIDRLGIIKSEQVRILDRIAGETERHENALAEIERFQAGAEPPSDAAIARTRAERDEIWRAIRARYLSPDGDAVASRPLGERLADAELNQQRIRQADDLADRKSTEASRVAALDQARKQQSAALAALGALVPQQAALAAELTAATEAWRSLWPEASALMPELGRLKAFVAERAAVLAQVASWRAQAEDLETQTAAVATRLAALNQAETALALPAEGSLAARIAAATRAIKSHDDAYADYRQDEIALRDVVLKIRRLDDAREALNRAEIEWQALWRPAARALGLDERTSPERANEIAVQWATATGLLDGVRNTRRRLQRMDEDEADLRAAVAEIGAAAGLPLPDDPVAAAKMLVEQLEAARRVKIERDSLIEQLATLTAERDDKSRVADAARDTVAAHCREAACEQSTLSAFADRCRARAAAAGKLAALAETITQSGDGLPIETLRAHWAERDLDTIRATLRQREGEAVGLIDRSEAALAELRDRERELAQLSGAEGVNAAVAERERATAEIHSVLERYIETALAEELLRAAMDRVREQRKDPLILRAGALFADATAGAFAGIDTEIDAKGQPVVVGRRMSGALVPVAVMSDGVRDQLFLAFRIASIEQYCQAAEPLPFIADDVLVHFDDERGAAALRLLAELGKTTQVLVFTHHRHVRDLAAGLAAESRAAVIDLSIQRGGAGVQ
jgi:uncharacterized protein YhaN